MTTLPGVALGPPVAARPYGLLASADVFEGDAADQQMLEGRWTTGYEYSPEGCGGGGGVVDPCAPGSVSPPENPDIVAVKTFGVWEADSCSAIGWDARNYEARAKRLLLACQSKKVEREFWTGTLARARVAAGDDTWENQQYLAREDTSDVVGLALAPADGLACLEQALANCSCGRGMIHATPQLVTIWAGLNLIERDGEGRLVTKLDTVVVPGAGYTGSSPTGAAAGTGSLWAYATGWVRVLLGPIQTVPKTYEEAVDRSVNRVSFYAQRLAAYDFGPCCHAAVEVDADPCLIGGS